MKLFISRKWLWMSTDENKTYSISDNRPQETNYRIVEIIILGNWVGWKLWMTSSILNLNTKLRWIVIRYEPSLVLFRDHSRKGFHQSSSTNFTSWRQTHHHDCWFLNITTSFLPNNSFQIWDKFFVILSLGFYLIKYVNSWCSFSATRY